MKVTAPAHAMLSEFTGVSCATATFCAATGNTASSSGSMAALIGRWNGKTWSYLKPAAAPKGVFDVALAGVSCPAANSCVTAGNGALSKGGTGSFIETWNGKAWVRSAPVSWPKGTKNPWLVGMSCYAAGHCFAAGYIDWNPNANGGNTGRAAAAQWNGKSWTSTPVTPPGAGKATLFDAVTCRSAQVLRRGRARGPVRAVGGHRPVRLLERQDLDGSSRPSKAAVDQAAAAGNIGPYFHARPFK